MITNLDTYDGKDLQHTISICRQYRAAGLVDILAMENEIEREFSARLSAIKSAQPQNRQPAATTKHDICPSCGRGYMVSGKYLSEAEWCSAKCGYSRMVK